MLKAGDTFLAQLPDGSTNLHLCLVLTEEGGFFSSVFVVPVLTPTAQSDRTTMLQASEHPFLRYESCVSYAHLVEQDRQTLEPKIVRHDPPISPACLERVIEGAFRSPLTPRGVRQRLKERLQEIA